MKNFLTLILALFILPMAVDAQRECGSMDQLQQLQLQNPAIIDQMRDIEEFTKNYIENEGATVRAVVTIPVIFHVVYKATSENISTAQLMSQLDVLNEDFRRMNADANGKWGAAADTEIEFCLATVDPSGNTTTGIQRRKTNKRSFQTNDAMKYNSQGGIDAWPASDYLNFWVCNISGGILGYAQFPGGPAATDGVVCDYAYTGRGGSAQAPFDLGRTATHEVGHWLNLRHIWGDGGCSVDDFVGDTPTSDAPNYGCPNGHVSCSSEDMIENYMDYTDDGCMNLYTSGQKSRMQALFAPGGARASLLASNGCGSGTGGPTCSDNILNGSETDVDCGGPDCAPCNNGDLCSSNSDCASGNCVNGVCQPVVGGSCDAPSGQFASNIKRKRAKVNWSAASGAVNYDVQVRSVGSSSWTTFNTSNTNLTVSGLSNNTTYEWQVRTNCSSESSAYSGICTFTAGNAGSGACGTTRLSGETSMKLFPNPVSQYLNVEMGFVSETSITIQVVDVYGKVVLAEIVSGQVTQMQLNVQQLTSGMYFLTAETTEGYQQTQRFIVNK